MSLILPFARRVALHNGKKLKQPFIFTPNIKYLPSVSANPREEHIGYYGISRPVNDPFWDEHLPQID